jgi:hypothetical protein
MKEPRPSPPIDPLDVFDPARWGLCLAAILDLGLRLYCFWERYRHVFVSRTRDTSANAYLRSACLMRSQYRRTTLTCSAGMSWRE